MLDEPTNDLDIETLDLLQEMLADYPGTIVLVSHDRDFLDRVATSVLVSEGAGLWREYAGGYSDMLAQRGFGLAGPAAVVTMPAPAKSVAPPAAARTPARKKMSFNDKHALEKLPGRIEALRGEIAQLETTLADAGLHARDAGAFAKATQAYAAKQSELSRAEEEWLRLEMAREAAQG